MKRQQQAPAPDSIQLDLTPKQLKALAGRTLIAVVETEACTNCDGTFTSEEQRAFDPDDNDHCPNCGARGSCTTWYGDPRYQNGEGALVYGAGGAFVRVVKRKRSRRKTK